MFEQTWSIPETELKKPVWTAEQGKRKRRKSKATRRLVGSCNEQESGVGTMGLEGRIYVSFAFIFLGGTCRKKQDKVGGRTSPFSARKIDVD